MLSVTSWWCSASAQTAFTVIVSFISDAWHQSSYINSCTNKQKVTHLEGCLARGTHILLPWCFRLFLKYISVVGAKMQLFHVTWFKVYLRLNWISVPLHGWHVTEVLEIQWQIHNTTSAQCFVAAKLLGVHHFYRLFKNPEQSTRQTGQNLSLANL